LDPITGDLSARLFFTPHEGVISFYDIRDKNLYPTTEEHIEKVLSLLIHTRNTLKLECARDLWRIRPPRKTRGNVQSVHKAYSHPKYRLPVEDVFESGGDEVRADMQDVEDYSEGVVNKSSKTLSIPNV
jgi:hypothetical protein